MRVFLTGASGYVGLHVARALLADGHRVTALVRAPARLGPLAGAPGLDVVVGDLDAPAATDRIAGALAGHDACVHAALVWGAPETDLDLRDSVATAKLFDAAGRAGVTRCVYVSSAAVHRPFTATMDEEDTLAPTDVYGATKAAGELFLRAACATHGMTGVVLRPGPVVGPPAFAGGALRTDRRIAEMVEAAVAERPIEVPEGEGRQLVDVRAFAEVTRRVLRAAAPAPTYLCVDRAVLAWETLARIVVTELRSASPVRVVPSSVAGPPPRFDTARVEALLGGPTDARAAFAAHVRVIGGVG